MHQWHDKTRKCDGKHMEIAGRGGAAEHIYIYIYSAYIAVYEVLSSSFVDDHAFFSLSVHFRLR